MDSEKGILLAKTIHLKHCGRTRTGKRQVHYDQKEWIRNEHR